MTKNVILKKEEMGPFGIPLSTVRQKKVKEPKNTANQVFDDSSNNNKPTPTPTPSLPPLKPSKKKGYETIRREANEKKERFLSSDTAKDHKEKETGKKSPRSRMNMLSKLGKRVHSRSEVGLVLSLCLSLCVSVCFVCGWV